LKPGGELDGWGIRKKTGGEGPGEGKSGVGVNVVQIKATSQKKAQKASSGEGKESERYNEILRARGNIGQVLQCGI